MSGVLLLLPRCCSAVPGLGCRTDGGNIPRSTHTQMSSGWGEYILQKCSRPDFLLPFVNKQHLMFHGATPPHLNEGTSTTPSGGGNNFQWGVFFLPLHVLVQDRGREEEDATPNHIALCEFCFCFMLPASWLVSKQGVPGPRTLGEC